MGTGIYITKGTEIVTNTAVWLYIVGLSPTVPRYIIIVLQVFSFLNRTMKIKKDKFRSQKEEVLYLLRNNESVSPVEFAIHNGILRYGQHIFTLRNEWYKIEMTESHVRVGKRMQRRTLYTLIH